MQRTKEEWMSFAVNLKKAVDACTSIGAVNAIELHNDSIFHELRKVSKPMHDHLIDHIDYQRVTLARKVKKGK